MDPVASCTVHPPRLTDNSTPINTHATTEPGGPPPRCHNGTITPHPQPEAVGRPQDTTETMVGQALLGRCPWLSSVPHRLLERLTWTTQPTAGLQGRDILLLCPRDGGPWMTSSHNNNRTWAPGSSPWTSRGHQKQGQTTSWMMYSTQLSAAPPRGAS